MQPDDMLTKLPAYWPDEAVPLGLAERIMQNARTTQQVKPWWKLSIDWLGAWDKGWEVKGAAFAALLLLGVISGQMADTSFTTDTAPHFSWTEGL